MGPLRYRYCDAVGKSRVVLKVHGLQLRPKPLMGFGSPLVTDKRAFVPRYAEAVESLSNLRSVITIGGHLRTAFPTLLDMRALKTYRR